MDRKPDRVMLNGIHLPSSTTMSLNRGSSVDLFYSTSVSRFPKIPKLKLEKTTRTPKVIFTKTPSINDPEIKKLIKKYPTPIQRNEK